MLGVQLSVTLIVEDTRRTSAIDSFCTWVNHYFSPRALKGRSDRESSRDVARGRALSRSPDSSPENKAISRAEASPAVYRADTLIEDSLCFTLHSNLRKDTSLRIENSRLNEKSALERRRRTKRRGMDRNLYAYRVKKKENNLKRLHLASPNDRDRSDRLSIIRSFRTRVSSRVSAPLPGLLF
jgi:hypothetical protein